VTRAAATITGIGLVTSLSRDVAGFFDQLCEGRSGLCRPPAEHPVAGIVGAAGIVTPAVDPTTILPPTEARCLDPFVAMAIAAADAALADAGIVVGRDTDPVRTAVVVANSTGGVTRFEEQALALHARGHTAVSPVLLPGMLPNMATARIAIKHGIRGFSSTVATACASGAYAVAEALRLIREDRADVVVCGGSDAPLLPTIATAFANARALATGWADPRQASRPFDKRRNGFVLGEGAGVLVVERSGHADGRRVAGYADILGWGVSTDAYHPTMPSPGGDGAATAMRLALADAGLKPGDIGYVNAHGTGTKLGDRAEAEAINAVFRGHPPAVSSTKAVTGHLLASAGAVEAAATALALCRGVLPPTHNLDEPDCELDHVRAAPRARAIGAAVSNSFAFGGHNISLVLGRATTGARRGGTPTGPHGGGDPTTST
jgi:3-oxoacyl-[acyl-carrier-protein] synthase II